MSATKATVLTVESRALLWHISQICREYDSGLGCLMPGELTPAQRGNLTDLKIKGLIEFEMEGDFGESWYSVTDAGREALTKEAE